MKRACLFAFVIFGAIHAVDAKAESNACSSISSTVIEGKAQRLSQLSAMTDPLSCIVPQIPEFRLDLSDQEPRPRAIEAYLSLTAAAILLVENDFAYVTRFRTIDDMLVVKTLASGAGHPIRSVRINSARLLASIVDNSTLCVVLDYLHAPVKPVGDDNNSSVNARANLLGVVRGAAKWIGIENQRALQDTLDYTVRTISNENSVELPKTLALISDIERRLEANISGHIPLSEREGCRDLELYNYWTPSNYYTQDVEMKPNPFLKSAVGGPNSTNAVATLIRDMDDETRATRAASLQTLLDNHLSNESAVKAAVKGISGNQLETVSAKGRVNILSFLERVEWCVISKDTRSQTLAAVKNIIQRAENRIAEAGPQTRGHIEAIGANINECRE